MDDKSTDRQRRAEYCGTTNLSETIHDTPHVRSLILRLQTELENARRLGADQICDGAADFLGTVHDEIARIMNHPCDGERLRRQISQLLKLIHVVRTQLVEMRREFHPVCIDSNLAHTIEQEVKRTAIRAHLTPKISIGDHSLKFTRHFETTVFRIAEQALSNVERHAAAREIRACYGLSDRHDLLLEIRDDGRGIPPDKLYHSESVGLVRMRELARLIGGQTEIRGGDGEGTRVFVAIAEEYWRKEYVAAKYNGWLLRSTYHS